MRFSIFNDHITEKLSPLFFKFMLREFETRWPQFDQLTQSAEGILSQTGDSAQDPKDLAEVRAELGSISQQWEDLTHRLSQRSNHIDQAQGTSERYQVGQVGVVFVIIYCRRAGMTF